MTSIKVFPKLNKINKYGLAPIYLRLIKNRRVKYLAMDVYINPNDWNDKTGKMKQAANNAEQINNFLAIKKSEAEMTVLEMESKSNFVSAHDLKAKMAGACIGDFFALFRKRLRERNDELSIGTLRRYNCVLNKLKTFSGKEQLFFDELNVTFLQNFKSYLQNDVCNHSNTVQSNLKVIRTLIYDAIAEELIPMEKNPFIKIKIKYEKTSREFLLDPELERLEKVNLKEDTIIFHIRTGIYSGHTRLGLEFRIFSRCAGKTLTANTFILLSEKIKKRSASSFPMRHASVTHTEVYAKILNQELNKAMEIFNVPVEKFA